MNKSKRWEPLALLWLALSTACFTAAWLAFSESHYILGANDIALGFVFLVLGVAE